MATAFDLYHKLDHEGDEGITWFTPKEFEDDPGLQQRFEMALTSYTTFQDDMNELNDYLEVVMANEERNSNS